MRTVHNADIYNVKPTNAPYNKVNYIRQHYLFLKKKI